MTTGGSILSFPDRGRGATLPIAATARSHLNVGTSRSINLKQFDRRPIHLDECDYHPGTWTVGLDDDLMMSNRSHQVIHFERDMRNALYQVRIRCIFPISLPLNSEGIVFVITDRHLHIRQRYFTLKALVRRNANMTEFHPFA